MAVTPPDHVHLHEKDELELQVTLSESPICHTESPLREVRSLPGAQVKHSTRKLPSWVQLQTVIHC